MNSIIEYKTTPDRCEYSLCTDLSNIECPFEQSEQRQIYDYFNGTLQFCQHNPWPKIECPEQQDMQIETET